MDAVNHGRQSIAHAGAKLQLGAWRMDVVEEAVEALPLLGGDLFANLARIFAGGIDAVYDGRGVEVIEDQLARHGFEAAVPLDSNGLTQCGDHPMPALLGVGTARIEHEAHGDIEQARGVLSPLEIAAHPVEAVGNAR